MRLGPRIALALLLLGSTVATAASVVRTEPANGAKDVSPATQAVRMHFDGRVTAAFGFRHSPQGEFPPLAGAGAVSWSSATCMEMKLGALKPNTTYAFVLQAKGAEGTTVVFQTGAAGAPAAVVPPPPPPADKPAEARKADLIGNWTGTTMPTTIVVPAEGRLPKNLGRKEIEFTFRADRTYTRRIKEEEGDRTESGRYTVMVNTVVCIGTSNTSTAYRFSFKDKDNLVLKEIGDSVITLKRVAGPPKQPPAPPTKEPAAAILGQWEAEGTRWRWDIKPGGAFILGFPNDNYGRLLDGTYTFQGGVFEYVFPGDRARTRTLLRVADANTLHMEFDNGKVRRLRRRGGAAPPEPVEPIGPAVTTRLPMKAGWKFQGQRVLFLDLILSAQDGSKAPLQYLKQTLGFIEEVQKVEDNFAVEVTRKITQAELETRGHNEKEIKKQQVAQPGTVLRVRTVGRRAGAVIDGTGEQIDEDFEEAIGGPLTPEMWPEGDLKPGMLWAYKEADLANRMPFECKGGQATLSVQSVARDPRSGLVMAKIRGTVATKVQPGDIPLDFSGQIVIDLPVAIGVPLVAKIEGTITAQTTITDQQGKQHPVTVSGKGTYAQTVGPAMSIIRAAGGRAVPAAPAAPQPQR